MTITACVVVALFGALVVQLWNLQIRQGPAHHQQALDTTTRTISLPGPRGLILASDGHTVLAGDQEVEVAAITATTNAAGERTADPAVEGALTSLVSGLTVKDINTEISSSTLEPFQPVPVTPGLNPNQIAYIQANPTAFSGVTIISEWERTYPLGTLATQTLGYVAPITASELSKSNSFQYSSNSVVGQFGLEAEYESALQGSPEVEKVSVDPSGNVAAAQSTTPAIAGDNIVLHMDAGLEEAATAALSKELNVLHSQGQPAPWGAVTVTDPRNGAVLTMVSAPGYNDNWWEPYMSDAHYAELQSETGNPLINYAVNSEQPPGSTFKLASATAALNDGLINASTTVDDTGSYTIGNTTLHDSESGGLGDVNVVSALAESSDVFFYNVGDWFYNGAKHYGATPIQNIANSYGIGASSGIDLPADEVSVGWVDSLKVRQSLYQQDPNVYNPPTWYPADNVEMAFGQGETVTNTLEIATAYATFANGGTRYAPELASEIESPSGKVIEKIAPKVMGHVDLPASTRALLSEGFQGAVTDPLGTATPAFNGFNFGAWNIAGKTGTATVSTNSRVPTTAWFVAYGGPKDQPARYVVAVEISEAGYGAAASAPVARSIFNYLYQHPAKA